MRAGSYPHRIDIQVPTKSQDDYGTNTITWSTLHSNIAAKVTPSIGRQYFEAKAIQSEITHKISMRYIANISPKFRIKFGNRYFNIISRINVEERNLELVFYCSEQI